MINSSAEVAVVLASAGRPELLTEAIRSCESQTHCDFRGIISVPNQDSLPADRGLLSGWEVLFGEKGAAAQRNTALDHLHGSTKYVFFFDDDAVAREDYLHNAKLFLDSHPNVVGMTGRVLADGKLTIEIDMVRTAATIEDSWNTPLTGMWSTTRELYGANFAFRVAAAPVLRFDARLPLYSWLEDHDFARRLSRVGPLAYVSDCQIVHRAASSGGRTSHFRLGYSQVTNPIYLWRKGSFPAWLAAQQLLRPVSRNLTRSLFGPQKSWRRRRLAGNLLSVRDILRGQVEPERAASLS